MLLRAEAQKIKLLPTTLFSKSLLGSKQNWAAQDLTEAAKHDHAVAAMANELHHLGAPIFGIDTNGDVNE